MGSLRIVAGRFRGRRLRVPEVGGLRPTAERARESLFNILGQDLGGLTVLDLFAGTGALGFEAASRGARRVVFVEADPGLARSIRGLAAELGLVRDARVVVGRVEEALDVERLGGPFDVILADPPYGRSEQDRIAPSVEAAGLLSPAGTLAVERDAKDRPGSDGEALTRVRTVKYGRTALDFFKFSYRRRGD